MGTFVVAWGEKSRQRAGPHPPVYEHPSQVQKKTCGTKKLKERRMTATKGSV